MADIQKLTYPYFSDNTTPLNAANLNPVIQKINDIIDKVNGGVTPTQTVATPAISISGSTATISCSTSGATIYYTLNGNTPTTSSTQYSSPITLSGACTIKAIAVKSGMNNSSVASQSYAPSDPVQTIVNNIKAKMSGVGNKETAVYNFVNALGAGTPNSGIWAKMKALYIPCLAIPSDGQNAFYDVISDTVIEETMAYQIESKRGVMPQNVGSGLSYRSTDVTLNNTSAFLIATQRTSQTLGSSAARVAKCMGINFEWNKTGARAANDAGTSSLKTGAINDFATNPETFVLSAVANNERTFITNEGTVSGELIGETGSYQLGTTSYAALSVFGLASGITASEAATISTALQTFITAYGIECSNS